MRFGSGNRVHRDQWYSQILAGEFCAVFRIAMSLMGMGRFESAHNRYLSRRSLVSQQVWRTRHAIPVRHNLSMNEEGKLVITFLAVNAALIAFVLVALMKTGINISGVLESFVWVATFVKMFILTSLKIIFAIFFFRSRFNIFVSSRFAYSSPIPTTFFYL